MRMLPAVVLAVAALTCLVGVSAVGAKTISGSARNDVLRGTAKADTLFGKQGRDTLHGLAGNDLLVPGPGADVVYCGAGRDTVRADMLDAVATDCEVVKRAPPAVAGSYEGLSSQNEQVTFDVRAAGPAVTRFRINAVNQSCQPPDRLSISGPLEFGKGAARVGAAGTFGYRYSGPGTISGNTATFTIAVAGTFTGQRASGTVRFDARFTQGDTEFSCSSGDVAWTARRT